MSDSANMRTASADAASGKPLEAAKHVQVDPNLDSLERLEAGGPLKVTAWSELPQSVRLWSFVIVAASLVVIVVTAAEAALR